MATTGDRGPAEQQGDGQPENLDELRDRSGGSALAGDDKGVQRGARRARGDEDETPRRDDEEGQAGE